MWDKCTLKLKMITRSDIESYNTTSGESPNLTLFCDMHKFLRCQLYEWKFFGLEGIYIKQMIFNLLSCLTQTYPTINTYEIWFCGCVIAKKRFVTFVICNCTKLPRMSDIYKNIYNIYNRWHSILLITYTCGQFKVYVPVTTLQMCCNLIN